VRLGLPLRFSPFIQDRPFGLTCHPSAIFLNFFDLFINNIL
jgi:hypothetical protein